MEIVLYPHPALRWKSTPVQQIDANLRKSVREMFDLMYASKGIGLAANQVALPYRFFILNLSGDPTLKDEEMVFINPEIISKSGAVEEEEGCLSFPGLYGDVRRSAQCTIEAFDLDGNGFEIQADDLGSRAFQHESDHLDGVLFVDMIRMTEESRKKVAPVVEDFERLFRKGQSDGKIPGDDVLKAELKRLQDLA